MKKNPLLAIIYNRLLNFHRRQIKYSKELKYWEDSFGDNKHDYYWHNNASSIKVMFNCYCEEFSINKNTFKNKIIVDIGCGPMGTLSPFEAKLKFGVDILANIYHREFDLAKHNIIYLNCHAHQLPFLDEFVDVVLSRNALDHVDNFEKTIEEIWRVLKPNGEIYLSINISHRRTLTEPHVISERRLTSALKNRFTYTQEIKKKYLAEKHRVWIIKGRKIL